MPDAPTLLEMVRTVGLITLLLIAAWTDARERRIHNLHLLIGFVAAVATAALMIPVADTPDLLIQSFTGASCGICAGFFLFWVGGIGAGDAKLLGVIGAFSSPLFLVHALTASALVGFGMALVHLIRHGGWRAAGAGFLGSHRIERRAEIAKPESARTIPYGIALAAGALLALFRFV